MKQTLEPDLVGYLWNCLDADEWQRIDAQLQQDEDLRAQLETLRQRLTPLSWDREPEVPPPTLLVQTLARVAEHVCRDRSTTPAVPAAPAKCTASAVRERSWWRRIDVVIAASVMLTSLGLLLPGVLYLRNQERQVECQSNLRNLWEGLQAYQVQHRQLPDIGTTSRPVAGLVVPLLRDAGVLPQHVSGSCPGTVPGQLCTQMSVRELSNLSNEEFERTAPQLLPGYAYSLGFRDEDGRLQRPDVMLQRFPAAQLPILGDAPASPVAFGNSPNHTGSGQNVLFYDGAVRFQVTRTVPVVRDDIYLNQANRVAAGLGPHDVVLGTSAAIP